MTGADDKATPAPGPSPWWSRWWGVLVLGFTSFLLVAPALLTAVLYATYPEDLLQGTTRATTSEISSVVRVLGIVIALVLMVWPVLTVRWALKKWSGWMMVGMGVSLVAFFTSLIVLGIL